MSAGADWTEQARRLLETVSDALGSAGSGADAGDGCRWCLHCQIAAVLRGDRPEISAAIADVLTTTSAALRSFAAGGGANPAGATPASAGDDRGEPPDVQRIEIA